MQQIFAFIILIIASPVLMLLYLLIRITSKGPFLFKQKRLGKDKKIFWIYKIRTMVENAESLKSKVYGLNEADGPVFKIYNDPRYTKIGKFLAHTGLDELPQLINIAKGEMSFVGPRPLPIEEATKVPKKYERRFYVLPGITSLWVIQGAHRQSFDQWMQSDLDYVKRKSMLFNFTIAVKTTILIIRHIKSQILNDTSN